MKTLIVGLGFGSLYKTLHAKLGHHVVTVDPRQGIADYGQIDDAINDHGYFDIAHICTPNFTHVSLASSIATDTSIVIVEKPGAANAKEWSTLVESFPDTRFMMSKNNMWRHNIVQMQAAAAAASVVKLNWINRDRIPGPGSWFTNKNLAYGGVSRDLMPHLLSLYISLNPNWYTDPITDHFISRNWSLDQLTSTEYGTIDAKGVYDVDDLAQINFTDKWILKADWRSLNKDQRNIECTLPDIKQIQFVLGLCPESAYESMIETAIANLSNNAFWDEQRKQDLWIHKVIDEL